MERVLLASQVSGEYFSQPLDVCEIRSVTLRWQTVKYANEPLSEKDLELGISVCCLWVTGSPHELVKNCFGCLL